MSAEEESMQTETSEPAVKVEVTASGNGGNENFVVLDVAGESEDSDKEDKAGKDSKEKSIKNYESDGGKKPAADQVVVKAETLSSTRPRKKPKAPVVDVNSLRKRKWQLKVYPLHAEDLQLNYMSILCKLASESLLYIPSEGRHGKAELYVATQKETATIIGKLLRMDFHHNMLSIEVVRKDTGGKEDGTESKKECKAFLMFDKFLSKKIFDAKGEKGTLVEKTVTLTKLPKAATKDFIGALFPFSTEIEIIESDNPDERKATVKCKTPVTSLLVYKSFKRLEINDVHVKISVDESVKSISLPPMYFIPPPEKKDIGPPDSDSALNQSSLRRRPGITPLNRRVQLIKKRAILNMKKPTRGQIMRGQRPNQGPPLGEGMREMPYHRTMPPRRMDGHRFGQDKMQGPGMREYPPMGPARRRFMDRPNDRRNRERDSRERNVTKEMLQLQNQLNQAIKNQIAMLNKTQVGGGGGGHLLPESYPVAGPSHKPLLEHPPRHFGGEPLVSSTRVIDHHRQPGGFGGVSWSSDRGGRIDRGVRNDTSRPERPIRTGVDHMERPSRPDNKRIDMNVRMDTQPSRLDRNSRDRHDRNGKGAEPVRHKNPRQPPAFGAGPSSDAGRNKGERSSLNRSHGSERGASNARRGPDFPNSDRSAPRGDRSYSSTTSHGQASGSARYNEYNQGEGDSSYFRHY
ncbi:unnamed protein product [Candidula unifasciata]|uniref:Uncharacterized protein n=1 Tax=Candidula unifasciata TaxID=100452 RepID=A0A8S3ZD24_9EUPU|nr:unnamed protein product [Candidula unifasciata]